MLYSLKKWAYNEILEVMFWHSGGWNVLFTMYYLHAALPTRRNKQTKERIFFLLK